MHILVLSCLIFTTEHDLRPDALALTLTIDRSRGLLDLKTVRMILGYKHRPKYRQRKKRSAECEVAVEKPVYDLTIFTLHCGKLTLKIYTKGERVLRIETVVHNTKELRCRRSVEYFPEIVIEAKGIVERFMNAVSCMDVSAGIKRQQFLRF